MKRVDIGYTQCVSDQRTGTRATTGTDRNIIVFCPADKIRNNQKITRKAHAVNNVEFQIQPFTVIIVVECVRRSTLIQTLGQAFYGGFLQKLLDTLTVGGGEFGQVIFAERQFQVAALGQF